AALIEKDPTKRGYHFIKAQSDIMKDAVVIPLLVNNMLFMVNARNMKRTKIVATLGPSTANKETLKQMMLEGMNICRYTAYKLASQRPKAPIYVFTSNRSILTQINLIWGVKGFYYNRRISTDHTISDIKNILKEEGLLKDGELVVNIASIPLEELGKSNMIKLSYVD
ncbi:pyruvate kinase, alpha/beta domain protein, partial [Ancylostoma ceylanicum]